MHCLQVLPAVAQKTTSVPAWSRFGHDCKQVKSLDPVRCAGTNLEHPHLVTAPQRRKSAAVCEALHKLFTRLLQPHGFEVRHVCKLRFPVLGFDTSFAEQTTVTV